MKLATTLTAMSAGMATVHAQMYLNPAKSEINNAHLECANALDRAACDNCINPLGDALKKAVTDCQHNFGFEVHTCSAIAINDFRDKKKRCLRL